MQVTKKSNPEPLNLYIHIARWVVPVSGPLIENGAVATFEGKIVGVGPSPELRSNFLGEIRDHGDSILCPALINAHSHLELSPLKWRLSPSGSFVDWVRAMIKARDQIQPGEWVPAIAKAITEMSKNGVIAVGDVGNLDFIPMFSVRKGGGWPFRGVFFRELISPGPDKHGEINFSPFFHKGVSEPEDLSEHPFRYAFAAHAPYSVAPQVLKAIKAWDQSHGLPFSIHIAESIEETEFLQSGLGPIRDLLEERGHWPLNYDLPNTSSVRYLEILGLLDRDTVCVHCVQVDRDDISILAKSNASVCLCPRSNVFLGVGVPPVEDLHNSGVTLALGTDSLASNDRLSIFAEMDCLSNTAPGIHPEAVFRAGTYGGARALGISEEWGTLAPGKAASFLAVASGSIGRRDVMEFLVHDVDEGMFEWVIA